MHRTERQFGVRVLQVSAFFPGHGGGIEVVAGHLARRLPGQGVAVHWMASGHRDEQAPADVSGLTVEAVSAWDPLEKRLGLPMPLWGLRALLRLWRAVGQADLVQVHDYLYQPSLAAILFARLRGRPVVVTQHIGEIPLRSSRARALLTWLNRKLGARVLAAADRALFVGAPVKAYFEAFGRFRGARPLLVPNGVDLEFFHPPTEAEEEAASGALKLLFVGRFVEKKGLLLLRQCLDLPGVQWTFVGAGPLPPAAAPTPTVQMPGRLEPAQIVALYQRSDLLVLPSTGEGFPLVVQEALACGTPVLVSREVAEAFPRHDPKCVFDVELRQVDAAAALRARLEQMIADRAQLRTARAAARALAMQWSWQDCVQAYCRVYEQLLRRGGGPSR